MISKTDGTLPKTMLEWVMSPEFQTALALGLVVLAVAFFVARWARSRKKPGCGGGCGCSGRKI